MQWREAIRMAVAVAVALLTGCATAVKYSDAPMERYDKNTDYSITERPDGFVVDIRYARYQFVPESDAVSASCRSQATALAWEVARKRGKAIDRINDQEIKISMGRNGVTGITSCRAQVPVYYSK